jgi:type II secretory pathway pseudopilin PulG
MRRFKTIFRRAIATAGAVAALAVLAPPAQAQATALSQFTRTINAAISGHNTEHLTAVTPEQCAAACTDASRASWCRTFDYDKTTSQCDLSSKRASEVGGLKTDFPGNPYDHYALIAGEGIPNPIAGPQGRKHVLIIGIDGMRGDALFCNGCASTPSLAALAQGGAVHHNVLAGGPQSTLSGPGWTTQFTGYWAADHGVTDNSTSRVMLKPHVLDRLKTNWPTATVAVVADWPNLTGNLKPAQANFLVKNAHKNSQQATDTVKDWLSWTHAPTAIFYYLHNVDIHAASWDPLNAFYQGKIVGEDGQIGQVLTALTARPNFANEEWLIAVVSDHGGQLSTHGGQRAGDRDTILILNNTYGQSGKTTYCRGDLTGTPMLQVDALTPHVLNFLGLPNPTTGRKSAACGN